MLDTQDFSLWPMSLLLVLILLFVVLCIWGIVKITEANQKRALTPSEKLLGQFGRALGPISTTQRGKVRVFGEIWDAFAIETDTEAIPPQAKVKVVSIDSLDPQVLRVTRL